MGGWCSRLQCECGQRTGQVKLCEQTDSVKEASGFYTE